MSNLSSTLLQNGEGFCSTLRWCPPYSLDGVPVLGYNITISQYESQTIAAVFVTDTEFLFCPEFSYFYTMAIAAFNGEDGETSKIDIDLCQEKGRCERTQCTISNDAYKSPWSITDVRYRLFLTKNGNDNWNISLIPEVHVQYNTVYI